MLSTLSSSLKLLAFNPELRKPSEWITFQTCGVPQAEKKKKHDISHFIDSSYEKDSDDEHLVLHRRPARKILFECFGNSCVLFIFLVGVCNTDNFSLLSITIDYGPFGFMDEFNPGILTYIDEPLFKDLPQPTLLPL